MKTINIKGKEYVTVNERVKEFHRQYPNGYIITDILQQSEDSVTMKSTIYPEGEKERLFTGIAHEVKTDGMINKAAKLLNLSFRSMRYRVKKHNINAKSEGNE